jgi:hypothetical protein
MVKSAMSPILLFPLNLSALRNGTGRINTKISNIIFVDACAAQLAKNTSASLLPHATQVPSSMKFQFLAMGLQENSARQKKVVPHSDTRTIMPKVILRASGDCMSKRRRYCNRMEILIKAVLAVYIVFVDQTCLK